MPTRPSPERYTGTGSRRQTRRVWSHSQTPCSARPKQATRFPPVDTWGVLIHDLVARAVGYIQQNPGAALENQFRFAFSSVLVVVGVTGSGAGAAYIASSNPEAAAMPTGGIV